jgi:hypothetical protein
MDQNALIHAKRYLWQQSMESLIRGYQDVLEHRWQEEETLLMPARQQVHVHVLVVCVRARKWAVPPM